MTFLPIDERFREATLSGAKTVTSRNKKYGERGDILDTPFGVKVRLLDVGKVPLSTSKFVFYRETGVKSPAEFEKVWNELHPVKPYQDDHVVYLHKFKVVR